MLQVKSESHLLENPLLLGVRPCTDRMRLTPSREGNLLYSARGSKCPSQSVTSSQNHPQYW